MPARKKTKQSTATTRLYRSKTDQVFGGVASGLAKFFKIDPTVIRVLFALFAVFGGSGLILYLVLWLIIPTGASQEVAAQATIKKNAEEIKVKARGVVGDLEVQAHNRDFRVWFGFGLLILGVSFLLENFGLRVFNVFKLWPLIIIAIAWSMLSKK